MIFFHYYLIEALPVIGLISLLVYLPLYFLKKKKCGKRSFLRHLSIYALIGISFSLIYTTSLLFWPDITFNHGYHQMNLKPFAWVDETYSMGFRRMLEQLLLNIVMIIPLGFILPVVFENLRKWWKIVILVMVAIFCLETFQYFIGRSADIDDLIMNMLGGFVGFGIFALLNKYLNSKTWWQKMLG